MNEFIGEWVLSIVACLVPVMGLAVAVRLISGMGR